MAEPEIQTRARVTLEVTITLHDLWGPDATLSWVMQEAKKGASAALRRMLIEGGCHEGALSELNVINVVAITSEEKGNG